MPKVFTYDQTYGPDATQRGIFDLTASPIVGACCVVVRAERCEAALVSGVKVLVTALIASLLTRLWCRQCHGGVQRHNFCVRSNGRR